MSNGFKIGGALGTVIGVFFCIATGFYDGFAYFGIGGFLVGGIIVSIIEYNKNSNNATEARRRIANLSDNDLKEKIQEIRAGNTPITESRIRSILNMGNVFLALRYRYNDNDYYTWLLKDQKGQIINITKHDIKIELPNISIKEISASEFKYHPEQLIYTGATVGGVSMGGFHTQEAYISESFKSSGKYGLYIPFVKPDVPSYDEKSKTNIKIDTIYLSKSLLERVPQELKRFVKGQKLELKHEDISESNKFTLDATIKSGNQIAYSGALQKCYFETQLTKTECQNVKNWILGLF